MSSRNVDNTFKTFNTLKQTLFFFDCEKPQPFTCRPRARKTLADLYDNADHTNLHAEVEAYLEAAARAEQEPDGNCYDVPRFLYEKVRVSSDDLLTKLALYLHRYHTLMSSARPIIPWTLKRELYADWAALTADVQYIKREWQCTRSATAERCRRDSVGTSDIDTLRSEIADNKSVIGQSSTGRSLRYRVPSRNSSMPGIAEHFSRDSSPAGSTVTIRRYRSLERPPSDARSVKSVRSTRSKYHRQIASMGRFAGRGSTIPESESDGKSVVGNQNTGYWNVVTFQLSSKVCREKGWTVGNLSENELTIQKILVWAVSKLRTAITQRKNDEQPSPSLSTEHLLCFYGDHKQQQLYNLKREKSSAKPSMHFMSNSQLLPQLPLLPDVTSSTKVLRCARLPDESSVTFYPSGNIAIVVSRNSHGAPGCYTVAYGDATQRSLLACFTPSGRGCCYRTDGSIWYVATVTAGWLTGDDGLISSRWEWPAGDNKLQEPVVLQLNAELSFHCSGLRNTQLILTCDKETTKVSVGQQVGAEVPPTRDELGQLLSGMDFDSKAAKNFMRHANKNKLNKQFPRRKDVKLNSVEETGSGSVQTEPATSSSVDTTLADMDPETFHATLVQKIRTLTETWLETYRAVLELTSDDASIFDENFIAMRDVNPAKTTGPRRVKTATTQRTVSGFPQYHRTSFLQSAPPDAKLSRIWKLSGKAGGRRAAASAVSSAITRSKTQITFQQFVKFNEPIPSSSLPFITRCESSPSMLNEDYMLPAPRVSVESINSLAGICPQVLRNSLLGETGSSFLRCTHRSIPHVTDYEFDIFLRNFVPSAQLIVISVVSSMCPDATPFLQTLEQLYSDRCRKRPLPCVQSQSDGYRLLLYDIATAAAHTGHSQSLLSRRHNVIAGMFLIYRGGRLLFCDHIFNGYGNDVKNFTKQLQITSGMATRGHCLPDDFLFSPQCGPHGLRSAWGGEIGGAGLCSSVLHSL